MTSNSIHNKLAQYFAKEEKLTVSEFLDLLKQSSRNEKMSIRWFTEGSADGSGKPPHMSQHKMWWEDGPTGNGIAGGSNTKQSQDQFNLQVTPGQNNWRTLSYNLIDRVAFKGKIYKVI